MRSSFLPASPEASDTALPASPCRIEVDTDVRRWEALYARLPVPALTQASAYGDAKAAESGWQVERLVFHIGPRPVALCLVLVRRLLGLPVAARINRGPLFLAASPTEADIRAVYGALRQRWRFGRRGVLFLAPGLADSDGHRRILQGLGFRPRGVSGWRSAVLDLRRPAAELRRGLASNWRSHLNGAERNGLAFELSRTPEALAWILARHAAHMREKGFVGTSLAFLRALARRAPDDVFVARVWQDGTPLAGMILCRFGASAEYFVGWYGPEARRAKAGHFLVWHAAQAMAALGCERFDLGGYSSADGYGRFKQDMRGTEYALLEEWVAF